MAFLALNFMVFVYAGLARVHSVSAVPRSSRSAVERPCQEKCARTSTFFQSLDAWSALLSHGHMRDVTTCVTSNQFLCFATAWARRGQQPANFYNEYHLATGIVTQSKNNSQSKTNRHKATLASSEPLRHAAARAIPKTENALQALLDIDLKLNSPVAANQKAGLVAINRYPLLVTYVDKCSIWSSVH